jgi:hypothetical protein
MKAAGAGGVIKGRTARTVAGQKVMAKRGPAAKRISAARPGGTVVKPKGLKPGAIKAKSRNGSKVDVSPEAFTRRTRRAQKLLNQAQKEYTARGRTEFDKKARGRVNKLMSAVMELKSINRRARNQGLRPIDISRSGTKYSTAPKLTRSQKAAQTRLENKIKKTELNRRRIERAREWGVSTTNVGF